jgi:hypothetical protein
MKKISTVVAKQTRNFRDQRLTIGFGLGGSIGLVLRVG